MAITAKTKTMCEALLVIGAAGQFTNERLIEKLHRMGCTDNRFDLLARLQRLVRNGCVRIANEQAVAGGAEPVYEVMFEAIVPYMNDDRMKYELALNNRAQPALFEAWGIGLPEGFHSKKYPKARTIKHSWN